MAKYFREFHDLTSDHENIPHENLVLWWVWLRAVLASTCTYVHVRVRVCTYVYPAQYSELVNCLKQSAHTLLKMSLYAYFKKISKSCLPNLQGPLSEQLPSSK